MAAYGSARSRDRVIKALAWVGGILAAVAIGTGVYVAFRYRPDASGVALGMQRLHALSSIVLALVTVVGLAAFVWERRPDRRHGLPAFGVVLVVALALVVETRTGWRLAWNQVVMSEVIGGDTLDRARGVFLRDLPVEAFGVDGVRSGADDFRRTVWLHLAVLPVLIGVGIGFVVVWTRRFARPEARPPRPTDA